MAYLDHAASTPIRREVLDRMLPYLCSGQADPDAKHARGREARTVLEEARLALARELKTSPAQLRFTRGREEANRLALLVLARKHGPRGGRILVYRNSHPSVLDACSQLESEGFFVDYLEPDQLSPTEVEAALQEQTFLTSFPLVDPWSGKVHPLSELTPLFQNRAVLVHLDASLYPGEEIIPDRWEVQALTLDAQTYQGPRNSALLWLAPRLSLDNPWRHLPEPRENQDLASVVGLTEAVLLGLQEREDHKARLEGLKHLLALSLQSALEGFHWLTAGDTSPAILGLSFKDLCAQRICQELDHRGVCISATPCGGLRLSLGQSTTRAELEQCVDALSRAARQLRAEARRVA